MVLLDHTMFGIWKTHAGALILSHGMRVFTALNQARQHECDLEWLSRPSARYAFQWRNAVTPITVPSAALRRNH